MTLEGYAGWRGDGGFGKHGDICGGCQWVGLVRSARGCGGFFRCVGTLTPEFAVAGTHLRRVWGGE